MSIAKKSETGKGNLLPANSLLDMPGKMGQWICEAVAEGRAFHEFESEWHEMIRRMANLGTGLFISQQGDGDLGETVITDDCVTLQLGQSTDSRSAATEATAGRADAQIAQTFNLPVPFRRVELDPTEIYEYEVLIFDQQRGRELLAAIELVSPANKDRPETR